ncbi:sigma-70 family RNA polymerase sigma factor [Galbitalea sp. SE-J8]|uniref:RNA polymerase sigma factor n=1 Tax=Galbitalea sp. SE-J8 TaxID=3054952 RepID=UPI00259D00CB|nr:sigma-70 family RNA polymerase sigma factor [Galbitalea sp. SE-J8]MDM4763899.1 sigma-70 family RNA polymerase sigma factor [Galbitalea sp. SE-J8]
MSWGADAQYTRLVAEHGTALLRLAVLLTGNRFDGEDALQDALVKVAASWTRTRPTKALPYLKRAVANASFDLIRRRRETAVEEVPERAQLERGFLRYEQDVAFFALVDALPDGQRRVLILRYFADLDDRAIAETLDITPETVRSQAHRGLAKLRADLAVTAGGAS